MTFLSIFCDILSYLYFDTPLGNVPILGDILNALGEQFCSASELA